MSETQRACACRFDDDGGSAEPVVKCWYHKNRDEKFEVEKAKLTHKVEKLNEVLRLLIRTFGHLAGFETNLEIARAALGEQP